MHETFAYLEPPWEVRNGECVVKGTSLPFEVGESGGPRTKYAALFDGRPQFDNLRVSFLRAAGGKELECLAEAFAEYLESGSAIDENSTEALVQYMQQCSAHFGVATPVDGSPRGFEDKAWPLLVDCMCDEGRQFYLSANELLLVCELCHQNVAVFGAQDGSARFLGAVTGHEGSVPVLVALQLRGDEGCVRSHFQRLVLLEDL